MPRSARRPAGGESANRLMAGQMQAHSLPPFEGREYLLDLAFGIVGHIHQFKWLRRWLVPRRISPFDQRILLGGCLCLRSWVGRL